ncbi:Kinesin-associated protein 3 [Geodia barretti]|uniref:Kinesin-associated protein 3 n=1 Tax=Geodia barretti TaxID=519541 RepID=A0AA35XL01_GEOBA|nr:Kinesin-associated protein 3 [Geodia barretti]
MDGGVIHRQAIDRGLDIHPSRKAIVVHYALEAVATNEFGEPVVADSKDCAKIINIKGLSRTTNVPNLAKHIVESCNLIDPAKLPVVEQLLLYLQARRSTKEGEAEKDVLEASTKKLQKQIEDRENSEEASMVELDVYVEGLYDDLHAKTKSTELILQLARLPENLIELANNNSLLLALSRVLRDDWKKSIDLTTNIMFFFFCFSTFSDFHRLLTQHKIGSLCMTVVEHELKRHRALQDDVSKKKKEVKVADGTTTAKREYEKAKKKYHSLLKKQDTLLRVCLYLLCNLAEDTRVELKMHGKGLVKHLLALLERENTELLILAVSFLKKMSIFRENKDQMAEGNIVKKLVRIFPNKNEVLLNMTLRLLLNLSFDPALRLEIVRGALLPELTALLDKESHVKVVLSILYHISFDSKYRAVFAYTDCIPKLMKMIVNVRKIDLNQK